MNRLIITIWLAVGALCWSGGAALAAWDGEPEAASLPEDIVQLVEDRQYELAVEKLEAFVAEEENNADAWNYLGYSQRKIGRLKESLTSYRIALAIDGEHLNANEYLGELYLAMEQPDKAQQQLDKLARLCGDCEQYQDLQQAIAGQANN